MSSGYGGHIQLTIPYRLFKSIKNILPKKKKVWQGLFGKIMTEAQNIEQGFTIHKQVT